VCSSQASVGLSCSGGDYDLDLDADAEDTLAYLTDYESGQRAADFNGDGVVDETDFDLFDAAWKAMQ